MTTYFLLDLAFLGAVGVVALATFRALRDPIWRAVGLVAIPLVVLTAVFDNVLVGSGIVAYDPSLISGIRIGVAPVEDFSYAIAAVVLLPCLWSLLARREPSSRAAG
jgi:lycopene cyclase domain-containing protein